MDSCSSYDAAWRAALALFENLGTPACQQCRILQDAAGVVLAWFLSHVDHCDHRNLFTCPSAQPPKCQEPQCRLVPCSQPQMGRLFLEAGLRATGCQNHCTFGCLRCNELRAPPLKHLLFSFHPLQFVDDGDDKAKYTCSSCR